MLVHPARCSSASKREGLASACAAPYSQQGSSKAGIPWWGGLIIGLVALALIGALAGLAAFFMLRRRRARRGSALEEAVHKQVPAGTLNLGWPSPAGARHALCLHSVSGLQGSPLRAGRGIRSS